MHLRNEKGKICSWKFWKRGFFINGHGKVVTSLERLSPNPKIDVA